MADGKSEWLACGRRHRPGGCQHFLGVAIQQTGFVDHIVPVIWNTHLGRDRTMRHGLPYGDGIMVRLEGKDGAPWYSFP